MQGDNRQGIYYRHKRGEEQAVEADTVVPALPFKPKTSLLIALKGKVAETDLIGNRSDPRLMIDALAAGWRFGKTI